MSSVQYDSMQELVADLTSRIVAPWIKSLPVIPWASPVPVFGDLSTATVATLGLNPSNREFVDATGRELEGVERRLPTLRSLDLRSWKQAEAATINAIVENGRNYFAANPYDGWFSALDKVIRGTNSSYYQVEAHACHLDLIPYATYCKWTELTAVDRCKLLDVSSDILGRLLRSSHVSIIVVNGASVISHLEKLSNVTFRRDQMPTWCLPRRKGLGVTGYAVKGIIHQCGGIDIGKPITVVGFNHNLQSSFGVTSIVKNAIRDWIKRESEGINGCLPEKQNSNSKSNKNFKLTRHQVHCPA